MAKDHYDKLLEIANRLKERDTFFREHDINGLQAFIRDAGRCQYCASEYYLYESYATLGDSATDHLLPRSKYEEFGHDPRNLVACCVTCNKLKGSWDPATQGGEPIDVKTREQLEEHRNTLVERAREHIGKNPDQWQAMFKKARPNFEAAAAEYRLSVEEPNAA